MLENALRLPAEWEEQDAVLLALPHEDTDWEPILEDAVKNTLEIASAVSRFERVILLIHPSSADVMPILKELDADIERITAVKIPVNDTWTRDYGPITAYDGQMPVMLKFGFNGWGLKFPANLDNIAASVLHQKGIFRAPLLHAGMILEGGSIESDGKGTLLTTEKCLLERNRNPHLSKGEIEAGLRRYFGSERILWLSHGFLAGDDTDSHIDTLARLSPADTILHVSCEDRNDEHFGELKMMQEELESFRTAEGKPYRLIKLPMPAPRYDEEGNRLPATYANFLVINGAVLAPVYNDPADSAAIDSISKGFPGREIIGIDCSTLIKQHGSLHCVTMQIPSGSMK